MPRQPKRYTHLITAGPLAGVVCKPTGPIENFVRSGCRYRGEPAVGVYVPYTGHLLAMVANHCMPAGAANVTAAHASAAKFGWRAASVDEFYVPIAAIAPLNY